MEIFIELLADGLAGWTHVFAWWQQAWTLSASPQHSRQYCSMDHAQVSHLSAELKLWLQEAGRPLDVWEPPGGASTSAAAIGNGLVLAFCPLHEVHISGT